ncbi:hypothetical protein FNO01nite_15240 [Flavobacterium noncentrifugens]|uniref:YhhN-like protein n=1 Tax=Flavobacterium noncentrifugens TaxID=1128970 RepID=A0A1G8WBY8_9FLAO|nr:lysoplasmalogenase family protein [Flavobacterium noncentrifugens]GEP50852.1 hypothetical protein FNO01nite_15240 [Flavobacterium noncentrifugens]SDJ75657.1 YhhN-like protein [Flavobacterium noncentrifugens]
MKIKETALYLYTISSVIAIVGLVADNEFLLLVTKPIIIPSIYFYYLIIARRPNLLFTLFFVFTFIGDAVVLLKLDNLIFTMVPYLISYLLMIKFVFKDAVKAHIHFSALAFSMVLFTLLMFILSLLTDIHTEDRQNLIYPIIAYGIVLAALVCLSIYNFMALKTISGFYLLVACGCSIISDVFYILYNQHFHIPVLNYINAAMQLTSYYFFVKYMINRKIHIKMKQATAIGR